MKTKLVVLSGAGLSAESGIKTFRDSDGLWENHKIEDVATPKAFENNPKLVLNFYNQRRKQLKEVVPNEAHLILAELEQVLEVSIITQNVDDLHERTGSRQIIHLHGELKKVRPYNSFSPIISWENDLLIGDTDEKGNQLRPHIVWFGEVVPEMETAIKQVEQADILLIIGTSLQVYPAASLVKYAPRHCTIYVVDPHLEKSIALNKNHLKMNATEAMKILKKKWMV